MAALTHTRFAALALWNYAFRGAPGDADYQIDPKVPRQQRSVRIVLQDFNGPGSPVTTVMRRSLAREKIVRKRLGAERFLIGINHTSMEEPAVISAKRLKVNRKFFEEICHPHR